MKNIFIFLVLIGSTSQLFAQEKEEVDASKPTNLYSRLSNNLELNTSKGKVTTWGYRANYSYVPSDAHQLTIELPLLYNNGSDKFGIGDMRFRYFWVPYKAYEKKPGAFGLTIDVFAPTGDFKNGLGTSRWTIAPGVMVGFVFGKWGVFPIVSYQYSGKQNTSLIPENEKEALNGFTFQVYNSIAFDANNFIDFTPAFIVNNFENAGSDDFQIEANFYHTIKPNKLQVGAFLRQVFEADKTTIRVSLRIFL